MDGRTLRLPQEGDHFTSSVFIARPAPAYRIRLRVRLYGFVGSCCGALLAIFNPYSALPLYQV